MHQASCYCHIFCRINDEIKNRKGPVVIGISGAYTSGKTVFTKYLSEYLSDRNVKTQVLHYDDFHKPLNSLSWLVGDNGAAEVDVFYNQAFDADKLLNDVLEPMSDKGHLREIIKGLDWAIGQYDNDIKVDIDGRTVVLLEGMLLFRPRLVSYLDYKIFLIADEDIILERALIRDVPKCGIEILDKYRSRYLPVLRRYLSEDKPIDLSDIVIDNNNFNMPKIVSDVT